jgi:phytoene desaturase
MARVVVIGAGFGGLAAAARLSTLGHDVAVYEQSDQVGGKLGTYARDGFRFDTGPSLLTMPAAFEDLFAATGDPLEQVLDLRRLDPHCRNRFADGTRLDVPADRAELIDAVQCALGGNAGADWQRLLARSRRMWEVSRDPFVESPGPPRLVPLARRRPRDLPVIAPGRSLHWLSRRSLSDPRLRAVLERYATYSGSDPRRAPAALASIAFVEQEYGCWYVGGGLYLLADALAGRLPRGALRLETPVTGIEVSGGRISGVRLGSGATTARLAADAVVADVDAGQLYTQLLDRPKLAPRGTRSSAGFVLLLGLRGRPPDLAHHTVFFPPLTGAGYTSEFDAIFAGRPADAPTIYVSAPFDPLIAPEGDTAAFVLVNAPAQGPFDWDAPGVADRYARQVLGVLAERGLELRDQLCFCEVRTPADLARSTWSPGGAIYELASHGARAAFRRAANRSPVPGLFLTGGSAHPGGGLPLVALSARAVAGLIGPA